MTRDQTEIEQGKASFANAWTAALHAVQVSGRAPLSARHALHAALLINQFSDIAFTLRGTLPLLDLATARDLPRFRANLRGHEPSLGLVMALSAAGADGPRLEVRVMDVAPEEFPSLSVADLMVSLYNNGTVPRLMLVQHDECEHQMQHLLQAASRWWSGNLSM